MSEPSYDPSEDPDVSGPQDPDATAPSDPAADDQDGDDDHGP